MNRGENAKYILTEEKMQSMNKGEHTKYEQKRKYKIWTKENKQSINRRREYKIWTKENKQSMNRRKYTKYEEYCLFYEISRITKMTSCML